MTNENESQLEPPPRENLRQAAVAVIQQDNKFLAIKRSQTVRAPGKICFPGGGVEEGETIEEALVREMNEELGIAVIPIAPVWTSQSIRGFELNWYRATIKEGETIVPNLDEVESASWMTMEEMVSSPDLLDSNALFFQALSNGEFVL